LNPPPRALENLFLQISEYMPSFFAGLLVLLLGMVVGWLAKRVAISLLTWLRLDRLGARVGWRAMLTRGDLRAALYSGVGDIVMVLVVLVFLNNALVIWRLSVLSEILASAVVYLPNLALVAFILVSGVMLADVVGRRTEDGLREEGIPRARLAGRVAKTLVLAVVAALALWQLDFAREIVLAAFLIGFGAMGVSLALAIGLGSAKAIERVWAAILESRSEEDGDR
jgi:hypothetical protein